MKKYIALLLVLLPILVGCVNQEPEQSQSTTIPFVTLPPAYYEENSKIEGTTNGAVKQFNLPDAEYSGITRVGNGILLVDESELMRLRVLTGESCIPSAELQIEKTRMQQCVALSNGFAYYDPTIHSVLYLDSNLSQKHSVSLTEEMTSPIISPDGSNVYYCVGTEIRVLDVGKNISRLVKTQTASKQTLTGTCFDGSVLICNIEDELGNIETLYISAKDGKTLCVENEVSKLYTNQEDYLALWVDGIVEQWVCGTRGADVSRFTLDEDNIFDAMELGGITCCRADEKSVTLCFYSIPSATKKSTIVVEGIEPPELMFADKTTNCVWFVTKVLDEKKQVLLKWDLQKSIISDTAVYADVLYTAEAPDLAALKGIQERVDELNTKHGVKIRIWQDAIATPGSYALIPEHHPEAISDMLDQLETVLDEFPKKFVYKSIRSRLRLSLVRSVNGTSDGQQYWNGRDAYIALCSGSDIRQEFLKCFGLVIDSHVLGNSPIYDYWDTLNPEGFRYGKPDESYVTGEFRFFVDMESMNSGMIDRSRVFWQAMLPDNAELFKIESMQKKLTMLCKAIRDAWGLEKKTDVYPWEQYLEKPIASKK